jgi:PAS domain S-box-containing protein
VYVPNDSPQQLRQCRDFLQSVLNAIPEVTLVIDRDRRVVFANQAACQWAGVSDPVANQMKCYQVAHRRKTPCHGDATGCPLDLVLETGRTETVTHIHPSSSDGQRTVEVTAVPLRDGQGSVIGIIESWQDISQLCAAREEANILRQALEDRKLIERAKGIVMKRAHLDEDDAYRRLQKLASEKNTKLADLARTIITAEEALRPE